MSTGTTFIEPAWWNPPQPLLECVECKLTYRYDGVSTLCLNCGSGERARVVEPARALRLYHFCCAHSKRDIGTSNCLLIPQIRHPMLGCKVLWLTTEAEPDRESTGLGNTVGIVCDRMEFRYVVTDLSGCRPWLGSPERVAAHPRFVADLESYGDPEHWWIVDQPVRATFDRTWPARLVIA